MTFDPTYDGQSITSNAYHVSVGGGGANPTTVRLTGVSVGLMRWGDSNIWVVPAYIFTTDGTNGQVSAPAAADKYFSS